MNDTICHGFELIRDEIIAELKTRARLYRHVKLARNSSRSKTTMRTRSLASAFGHCPKIQRAWHIFWNMRC